MVASTRENAEITDLFYICTPWLLRLSNDTEKRARTRIVRDLAIEDIKKQNANVGAVGMTHNSPTK